MTDSKAAAMALDWIERTHNVSREEAFRRLVEGSARIENGRLSFHYLIDAAPPAAYVEVEVDDS